MDVLVRGRTLGERFRLSDPLGRGSLGEVWLVDDLELGEEIVAKFVPPEAPAEGIERLKAACRTVRRLHHPNIVPVFDFHRSGELAFVTMPFVEGKPLDAGPLASLLPILIRIAAALEHAHGRGVVHGDLKRSNILLDAEGEPRLLDFGIAGRLEGGDAPSFGEDVEAFGRLIEELLANEPPELEKLTRALLGREGTEEARVDMTEARAGLERIASSDRAVPRPSPARRVVVTPPPRVKPPARELGPIASGSKARAEGKGGLRWLTLGSFALLIGVALVVVFLLPRWVEEGRFAAPDLTPPAEPEETPPPALVSENLEELANLKTRAEQARQRATSLADALEARDASEWGGDPYREALRSLARGEELMASRSYEEALASFEEAREALESVRGRAGGLAAEAVARGDEAIADGRSAAARERFAEALRIEPEHAGAKRGLRRAETLDEVLSLLAAGEERERASDLSGAAELYRKAAALDPLSAAAATAVRRVDERASDQTFRQAMSEGMKALEAGDHAGARAAFERAGAIRPGAGEVASALSRTTEAERLETIAAHRERADAYERDESWRKAEAEYRAVLDIDPTIRFANEGLDRSVRYAELHEKIDYQLAHPERLSDERAIEEAAALAETADKGNPGGASLREKAAKLATLVQEYSTLVPVHIVSDNETEVTVYRVGRLGKFERRALELRPGTYTVVGSREGYRDVRHEIVVRAGNAPEPVLVRCEEKI